MTTAEERLQTLEGQVQALQGQQDALTPNAFSLNAQGKLEENLTGKLTAQGVIFEQGFKIGEGGILQPGSEEKDEIVWEEGEGGAAVASITSFNYAAKPPGTSSSSQLQAVIAKGGVMAGIEARLRTNPLPEQMVTAQAGATGGPAAATVITSTGASSFLQLAIGAKLKLAYGASSATFGSPSEMTAQGAVAHGLGVVPKFAIAAIAGGGAIFYDAFQVGPVRLTAAEVEFGFQSTINLTGSKFNFLWIAIG
jgi:hypothetical protein